MTQSVPHYKSHDTQGRRLYLTADERRAFIAAAATADRPVRTRCTVLHDTGCRICIRAPLLRPTTLCHSKSPVVGSEVWPWAWRTRRVRSALA